MRVLVTGANGFIGRHITAAAAAGEAAPPPDYERCMRTWFWLGWPAFLSLLGVFALMVMRPALW